MSDAEMLERVRELRSRGRTPKEIARATGLRPAEVAPLIRAVAGMLPRAEPALIGCWVSRGWSAGLGIAGHQDWPGIDAGDGSVGESGLASVLVARGNGGDAVVCGYLVDTWCLGVKNALGPEPVPRRKLPEFVGQYYGSYVEPPLPAPLDLSRQLVFGAVAYARGLGFEPHPDFAQASGQLGEWDGVCDITFGRDGVPVYIQGPHDDAGKIIKTLRRSVGDGNFHVLAGL